MALVNINFTVLAHVYVLYARALQSRIRGGTFAAPLRPALKSGTAFAVPAGPSTPPLIVAWKMDNYSFLFSCSLSFTTVVTSPSVCVLQLATVLEGEAVSVCLLCSLMNTCCNITLCISYNPPHEGCRMHIHVYIGAVTRMNYLPFAAKSLAS